MKAFFRQAEARIHADLLAAIAVALCAVIAENARGWFAACGYSFA